MKSKHMYDPLSMSQLKSFEDLKVAATQPKETKTELPITKTAESNITTTPKAELKKTATQT